MLPTDPQLVYLILVLPSIFGLVLIADGIYKMIHDDSRGVINFIFGFIFLAVVVSAYFFFSIYLESQI